MATVYRCVDRRLGREVAAKVMHEQYVHDEVFRERFRREARAMAQLSHPNLVNVYDFSASGDEVFLVMELITGGTLRELLAERGPMPPHAAAAVMRGMLTGLAVAHEKGMVHRDIKPDNVLIDASSRVKLSDFGLVRATAETTQSTDQIVGTVAYLSPEQVDGSPTTAASDVYSAGIVLFELLTGQTPFDGDTPLAHAYARLRSDVPAPSTLIAGVPKLFDELVATATSRNPADRFHDAADFLAALDDVVAQQSGCRDYIDVCQAQLGDQSVDIGLDLVEDILVKVHRIDLVHSDDHVGDLHHRRHSQVATGLLDHAVAGVNKNNNQLGGGQARDGVALVLHVAGSIGQDEAALVRGEVAVSHVDGDALLALGTQAVNQQREVHAVEAAVRGGTLHGLHLVRQHGLGVIEQAADEGGLAVIDGAGGAQAQGIALLEGADIRREGSRHQK